MKNSVEKPYLPTLDGSIAAITGVRSRDARVQRLYGGTHEIMLDLIGRAMGF